MVKPPSQPGQGKCTRKRCHRVQATKNGITDTQQSFNSRHIKGKQKGLPKTGEKGKQ